MAGEIDIRVLDYAVKVNGETRAFDRVPGIRMIVAAEADSHLPRLAVYRHGRADDDREVLASALETFLALVLR